MAWKVELDDAARKDLERLDRSVAKRILNFLHQRLAPRDNPRTLSEPLHGARFEGLCKYRVGDYRILCELEDSRLVVLVVEIGHRREIYR